MTKPVPSPPCEQHAADKASFHAMRDVLHGIGKLALAAVFAIVAWGLWKLLKISMAELGEMGEESNPLKPVGQAILAITAASYALASVGQIAYLMSPAYRSFAVWTAGAALGITTLIWLVFVASQVF